MRKIVNGIKRTRRGIKIQERETPLSTGRVATAKCIEDSRRGQPLRC
jgi:hypothetical protein